MTPADRRPIALRGTAAAHRASTWLIHHQASPNQISLAGMAAALLAGLAAATVPTHPQAAPLLWLAAAALTQLRLLANLLDGMVAIGRGIASPLGELYNEVPDRVSDTAILAGLGHAANHPALGWAAALAAMATAYIRAIGKAAGAPSDFRGPMAKQHRMALVTVLALFCAATPHPWSPPAIETALWIVTTLSLATAARRLAGSARALTTQPTSTSAAPTHCSPVGAPD